MKETKAVKMSVDMSVQCCRVCLALQDYFATWPQEGTVDLFEKIAELIIMTASRTLMGESPHSHMSSN